MKIISINGSARGTKGITHRLLNSFTNGLVDSGYSVKSYNLNELNIGHCKSCFSCMHNQPGVCSIKDDMTAVYEDLKQADALIIGAPLYTDTMSSRMKAFFDRCIASMQPFIHEDSNGRFRHSFTWKMPGKFILISTSGFPEPANFAALEATIKAQAYNFGSEFVASILIPGSLGLQMEISLLDNHLELIHRAGAEFGNNKNISQDLIAGINTPVLTKDEFYKYYLKYEEWCRKKLKL